jgi:hypothetical protein
VTLATGQPTGIRNPTVVRAKESELLAFLREHPGLRIPAICKATGELPGAVADRLQRLLRRGAVEKVGYEWRLPRDDDVDDGGLEPVETPVAEVDDPGRWVKPIGRFVRRDTGEFSCRRFG